MKARPLRKRGLRPFKDGQIVYNVDRKPRTIKFTGKKVYLFNRHGERIDDFDSWQEMQGYFISAHYSDKSGKEFKVQHRMQGT